LYKIFSDGYHYYITFSRGGELMGEIDIFAQLSDMKIIDYKNTLAIVSLIEVLKEKGIIGENDVSFKAKELDTLMNFRIESLKELKSSTE